MNSGGILFNPVQHWICVCLCCHSPWSYEVCLTNTAVLSVFVYFTTFLMYSNCFSKTLRLLSVPNKWDVSSWLSVHSSFLVSFSLSCSHLLLWIRFSHFLLLNLFNSKCWLFCGGFFGAESMASAENCHCHHLLACPSGLCSSWGVMVLKLFLKAPPVRITLTAPDGRGFFLRFLSVM